MRKTAFALLALALCSVALVWPVIGFDDLESLDIVTLPESQSASGPQVCGEAQQVVDLPEDFLMSTESLFGPTTSWNCNGCVEPSLCYSHADCGFPQGYCIQNSCRCICDPDV